MAIGVDFEAFATSYAAGRPQLVARTLVSDLETPVGAFLKLARSRDGNMLLLESVEGGAQRGRYSMIGLDPDLLFRVEDGRASVDRAPGADGALAPLPGRPHDEFRALLAQSAIPRAPGLPPMAAGIFGYLGYEMVREMERLAPAKPDRLGVPDALLMRPTAMVVFDSARDELWIVTPVRPKPGLAAKAAHEAALERIEGIVGELERPLSPAEREAPDPKPAAAAVSNTSPEEFHAMVGRAKEHILAGDIFQVVLSQRFSAPFDLPAFALYRALRRVNPSPYLCFLDFGGFQVVASSPEILVRASGGRVTIRPIAGTRPRGATEAEDRRLEADLLADPKERAEHLMLLDLGRNDVGRVAQIGTVTVTDSFFVERYSHVMHIVSNVEGALAPGRDALDALVAGFPAGTVSGAPKVRAMQIVDDLEKDRRGVYAGCIGYFGADGDMDTCIVLRTALVKDGVMHVQAGAGVVHDSVPASEQAECGNKARALFRAAEEAVRFASAVGRGQ